MHNEIQSNPDGITTAPCSLYQYLRFIVYSNILSPTKAFLHSDKLYLLGHGIKHTIYKRGAAMLTQVFVAQDTIHSNAHVYFTRNCKPRIANSYSQPKTEF